MKRPQFSLRLMLLVVTLIAACLGWRSAINYEEASDKARIRRVRLTALVALGRHRAAAPTLQG